MVTFVPLQLTEVLYVGKLSTHGLSVTVNHAAGSLAVSENPYHTTLSHAADMTWRPDLPTIWNNRARPLQRFLPFTVESLDQLVDPLF